VETKKYDNVQFSKERQNIYVFSNSLRARYIPTKLFLAWECHERTTALFPSRLRIGIHLKGVCSMLRRRRRRSVQNDLSIILLMGRFNDGWGKKRRKRLYFAKEKQALIEENEIE
jgi:hypothetical protein